MLYLDTSAFIKLAIDEPFHAEMRELSRSGSQFVSSRLMRLEARRVFLRRAPQQAVHVQEVLARLPLLPLSEAILTSAETVESGPLRTLDAIHLATALSIRHELDGFVTYDRVLGQQVRAAGLTVLAPGAL